MRDLTGAIIGTGYFAGFQAEAWQRIPGVKIAAVADPRVERAQEFASRWGIPEVYSELEALLSSTKLDFVDIVTRPEQHLPIVAMAAQRGIHALCQKPMAPAWGDCLEMVRVCREAKVRLLIHENWRWQPWYRELRRLLDQGVLGKPLQVEFRMRTSDGNGPEPYPLQPYFREMPRLLIHETAVHFLDTFRYLVGEYKAIFCRSARLNPAINGEDCVLAYMEFESGARGVIDANRTVGPNPAPLTFGALRLDAEGGHLRVAEDGAVYLGEEGNPETRHEFSAPSEGYKGDSVRALQAHQVQCLRTGERCESEGEDYLKTVAAVEACYRSAETGEIVEITRAP